VASDQGIAEWFDGELQENNLVPRLVLTIACGAALTWTVNRIEKSWILPVASLLIVAGFYLVCAVMGLSRDDLLTAGWLFEVSSEDSGALAMIAVLSFSDIDFQFMATVIPQILTVVFLVLLSASMSLSALRASSTTPIDTSEEFTNIGGGNLLCGLVGCPPGYSDPVASSLYEEFGASSRWMPLASSAVCLLAAFLGGGIIGYIPKILIGATVFLFAFQTLYEWMYQNVKGFNPSSYIILCVILGTVIFFGFMEGIGVGLILTVLLFVFRYSRISAIQARHTLREHRSSVERSSAHNATLHRDGSDVIVYTLRGFLFFGTANSVLDRISNNPRIRSGECRAVLMNMKLVTGIDISALNTLVQIKKICDQESVLLLFSGLSPEFAQKIESLQAVSSIGEKLLLFDEIDFAIEFMEDLLLSHGKITDGELSIHDYLADIIGDEEKVRILMDAMSPVECKEGEILFEQGEADNGFYIIEKGPLSALIVSKTGKMERVKKFRPGSLVGELSAYLSEKKRTATVIADEESLLFHLGSETRSRLDHENLKLALCINELVARTLAERVDFMNRRLMVEYV
jgi:SulP family sulfate permease